MTLPAQRVLLAGATGVVGRRMLHRLLADAAVSQVIVPSRRPLSVQSPKLQVLLSAMDSPEALLELRRAMVNATAAIDVYVCCLGTTLRKAGSKAAFLAVDRDLTVYFAEVAKQLSAKQVIMVSSVGASAQSGNFYLRVKGEVERLLSGLGFARSDFLRPGLLLAERDESRPFEALSQWLAPVYNPLLRGNLARYRAISADAVAAAGVALVGRGDSGVFIHEHGELLPD